MGLRKRENRSRAITTALKQIDKQLKTENICQRLGDAAPMTIETFSSGILPLDIALGGGVPVGRVIEIFGAESSGKSLIATRIMASVQQQGGTAALIDAEHAFSEKFSKKLGLLTEDILISQTDTLEQACEIIRALVKSNGVDVIVLDSLASCMPSTLQDESYEKNSIGLVARIMSTFLRELVGLADKYGVTVIIINQVRDNVGVMFGDPTTTPGGKFIA